MFKNKVDTYLRRAGYTKMKKWLPYPLAIWIFALDGNLIKILLNERGHCHVCANGSRLILVSLRW